MNINLNDSRVLLADKIKTTLHNIDFNDTNLMALAIGGSVSRGQADEYSDLELLCFWDVFPELEDRIKLIEEINAKTLFDIDEDTFEDNVIIDDIQVDITHNTIAYYDNIIADVLEYALADQKSLAVFNTTNYMYPLFGHNILNAWKEKTRTYPHNLAINVIYDNLDNLHNGNVEIHIQRDNPTEFYAQIVNIQRTIFNILSALNKSYSGGYKWMYAELDSMDIKPVNIIIRFKEMFIKNKYLSIEDLFAMVYETLYLINANLPDMNLDIESTFDDFMIKREELI